MQSNHIDELNGGALQMHIKKAISIQSNRIEKLSNSAFKGERGKDLIFKKYTQTLQNDFSHRT